MGFYVKGIKMPETCGECPCWWADAAGWGMSYCQAGSKYMEDPLGDGDDEQTKRPDDCPLVEVFEAEDQDGKIN